MNLNILLVIEIIFQISLFHLISAPYPKYYISNYCGHLKGSTIYMGSSGKSSVALLKLKRETYKPNLDCNVTIKAPLNHGIIAYVKRIKLRRFRKHGDSLEVISDNNMTSLKWFGNNEEVLPKINLLSNSNRGEIYVIFKSENFHLSLSSKGFKIVLTTFTLNNNGICGQNSSLGFNCNNKLCVDYVVECDGINNCINYFDEQNCSAASETMIGPIVFGLTILVMAVLIILFICKTDKKKRTDMARRFSKACINSGRRLSTMFTTERRPVPTAEILNQYNSDSNIYRSVPIIYESKEDKVKDNNLKCNSGINAINTNKLSDKLNDIKCQTTENI